METNTPELCGHCNGENEPRDEYLAELCTEYEAEIKAAYEAEMQAQYTADMPNRAEIAQWERAAEETRRVHYEKARVDVELEAFQVFLG